MPDPAVVYKYTPSKWALQILRNLEIKVTPPAELNDPFEFTAPFEGTPPRRYVKRELFQDKSVRDLIKAANPHLKRAELRKLHRELRPRATDTGVKQYETAIRRSLADLNREGIALLCASARNNGILLWAHYGDAHRGMAVGLVGRPWAEALTGFFRVEYSDSRPVFDVSKTLPRRSPAAYEMVRKIVSTKSPEWSYEEEYRAVMDTTRLERRLTDAGSLFFLKITPGHIQEVVIGSRCPKESEEELRALVSEERFRHVRVTRAVLDSRRFEISTEAAWP